MDDNNEVARIGSTIAAWLGLPTSEPSQGLARWIEGDDEPLDRNSNVPYLWFIEAIDASAHPRDARDRLAERVKALLDQPLSELMNDARKSVFRRPVEAMHNLLTLTAEVQEPEYYF